MGSETLLATASTEKNKLNIATADYLIYQVAPEATRPGQLINWAIRLDPKKLREKADELAELLGHATDAGPDGGKGGYEALADTTPIEKLAEKWTGTGADAFQQRWEQLRTHILGKSGATIGIYSILESQVANMRDVADKAEEFQNSLENSMNGTGTDNLGSVREAYVAALCEDGDEAAVNQALADAGLGATFGSGGGGVGIAAGAGIGAVVGFIRGFNDSATQKIDSMTGYGIDLTDLSGSIEDHSGGLVLGNYGDNNQDDLKYKEYSPASYMGDSGWDEAMKDEWSTKL